MQYLTPEIHVYSPKVFKLVKEQVTSDSQERAAENGDDNNVVFAVSRYTELSSESIWTAHEREMAQFRDSMQNRSWIPWNHRQAPFIAPAEAFMQTAAHENASQESMMSIDAEEAANIDTGITRNGTSSTTSRLGGGTKKVTTAASFFGKAKISTSSSSVPVSKATTTTTPQEDGKENLNKNEPVKSLAAMKDVGNADDFVGDMDDDEDDNDSEVMEAPSIDGMDVDEPQETNVSKKTQRKAHTKMVIMDDDDDDNVRDTGIKKVRTKKSVAVVHGAMDAFTTVVAKPNEPENNHHSTKQRRRRKKLVDKTTVDENGYLHTETQEVWEDIPSEEEQDPSFSKGLALPAQISKSRPQELASINSKKKTNKANMKQGNLMGFFQKK